MALLVDGNISNIGDLQGYDSAVLEVARSEGVDLEQKLKLAEQEIALELTAFLLRHRERIPARSSRMLKNSVPGGLILLFVPISSRIASASRV